MNKIVVVTGAAGYIGGQTALQLHNSGYTVIGIDRAPCPDQLAGAFNTFYQCDFWSDKSFSIIRSANPVAIVHCAGTSLVGPSVKHPSEYYHNNAMKTLHLLDLVCGLPNTKIIFSSSAATYGEPIMVPCSEVDPPYPISPYGESKLMIEMFMASYKNAYNLDFVAFRYFNACGADPQARHGQAPGATHIIARVLESIRDNQEFTLYGNNYPTPDGTCVRDYVHVDDIARAHVLAISADVDSGIYNLGSNNGTSNQEIINAAERITGQKLKVVLGPQRDGDPAVLTASADKFSKAANNWCKYNLDDMIQHAWNWYVR
jgi:UDP-glucose 4-epimerase